LRCFSGSFSLPRVVLPFFFSKCFFLGLPPKKPTSGVFGTPVFFFRFAVFVFLMAQDFFPTCKGSQPSFFFAPRVLPCSKKAPRPFISSVVVPKAFSLPPFTLHSRVWSGDASWSWSSFRFILLWVFLCSCYPLFCPLLSHLVSPPLIPAGLDPKDLFFRVEDPNLLSVFFSSVFPTHQVHSPRVNSPVFF